MNKKVYIFIGILCCLVVAYLVFNVFYFKKNIEADLKIGFVTDWEYSENKTGGNKKGESAEKYLSTAVNYFNSFLKPDLVVGGGDYIFGRSGHDKSLEQLQKINNIFKKNKSERAYCLGSRDINNLSQDEVLDDLGLEKNYYKKELKGFNLIFLDTAGLNSRDNKKSLALGEIEKSQLEWLEKELAETSLPVIIFSHHSIIETPGKDTWRKNLLNQEEVLALLKENNKKILAVFSGNNAEDYITKEGGIPFVVTGGLVSKDNLGRYSDIRIKEEVNNFLIEIYNFGENSNNYKIKRDLDIKTATRISSDSENEIKNENIKWFDVEDANNKLGVISDGSGGEVAITATERGTIIAGFEDKFNGGRIHIKSYKNEKWIDLIDEDYPKGLISLGKGGNPNITTKGEDVYVTFMEYDFGYRARVLKWSNNSWHEISPGGFISETRGHEPVLTFDKDKKYLYLAYAEGVKGDDVNDPDPENKRTKIIVKRWDGENWEVVKMQDDIFVSDDTAFEVGIASSKINNDIYIVYEKLIDSRHQIKIKKWNNEKWIDLSEGGFYDKNIGSLNGFSPVIELDYQDSLYLTFIQDNEGPVKIFKHNNEGWHFMGKEMVSSGKNKEVAMIISDEKRIFVGYSSYKKGIVFRKINEKGELELSKSGAWRVRVKEWNGKEWLSCEDDINHGGYISKGSGKGDPSMVVSNNNLYVIFSDEENNYVARVKKFDFN